MNGIGKLSSVVLSTTNVSRRDGDVLLNILEDELNTRVPLLLKTKLTSILQPYMLRVWVVLHSGFTNKLSSINALPDSRIACIKCIRLPITTGRKAML